MLLEGSVEREVKKHSVKTELTVDDDKTYKVEASIEVRYSNWACQCICNFKYVMCRERWLTMAAESSTFTES